MLRALLIALANIAKYATAPFLIAGAAMIYFGKLMHDQEEDEAPISAAAESVEDDNEAKWKQIEALMAQGRAVREAIGYRPKTVREASKIAKEWAVAHVEGNDYDMPDLTGLPQKVCRWLGDLALGYNHEAIASVAACEAVEIERHLRGDTNATLPKVPTDADIARHKEVVKAAASAIQRGVRFNPSRPLDSYDRPSEDIWWEADLPLYETSLKY